MKKDPYEKIKEKKCVVCGGLVAVDKWRQGECRNCGWYQGENDLDAPDKIIDPNIVSLNKARRLIRAGKPLKPDFDEFIEALYTNGEMTFVYKTRHFGLIVEDGNIEFYEWDIKGSAQRFKTSEAFKNSARIDLRPLKQLWNEVEQVKYMS